MNIQTEYYRHQPVRFVERISGDWWVVADDLAKLLDLGDAAALTAPLYPDEKGMVCLRGDRGEAITCQIISQLGAYEATLRSERSGMQALRRWLDSTMRLLGSQLCPGKVGTARLLDDMRQRECMLRLWHSLPDPHVEDFIKANTVANKTVSNLYGYPRMLGRAQMPPDMQHLRQQVLEDTVSLMAVNERFGLGLSISHMIYQKYNEWFMGA